MAMLYLIRKGNTLVPDGPESASALAKLPFAKPLRAEVRQQRNGPQHRLFWKMVSRIADAIGAEPENVSDLLKIETGHCTIIKSKKYGVIRLPRSISFASMDQAAFSDFFNRCVTIIETEWGIARSDVLEAVDDLLHPERHAA